MTEAMKAPEAKTTTEPKHGSGLLDNIEQMKPENAKEKTKKYLCGIRVSDENKRFTFQVRVGPAVFSTETFEWQGSGENAKQIFKEGSILDLSDREIAEIREKLKWRYLGKAFDRDGNVTGYRDVDASDGGDIVVNQQTGEVSKRAARHVPGRLLGNEIPLASLLILEPVYDNPKLNGRVLTVEDLKKMLAEAEEEEARLTEGDGALFEQGRGGKRVKAAAEDRDPKQLAALSTTDGRKKAEGGYLGK